MSDIIQLLPDSVANQIAAGEVVQRPSSVVKELVENAIDAGSTKIQVVIKDAGKTLIQVIDNGLGMSETDLRMCFERHATSKIRKAMDLFDIRTMGFRGEAMASIAAIATVEVKTKQTDKELGSYIRIAGSVVELQEPVSCQNGTNIQVKNLFFNVPARRKFLKSNSTELKHIIEDFQRMALGFPEVAMELIHNDVVLYKLPGSKIHTRIVNVLGKGASNNLIPVQSETSMASIKGYVGKPENARKTPGEQFFFINKRYMKHPYFYKAVLSAYENILPAGLLPSFFIYFDVDPAAIDINIHPTKTEIKFENEKLLWPIVQATVKEGLGKHNIGPAIDFNQEEAFNIPVLSKGESVTPPPINVNPEFNPFEASPREAQTPTPGGSGASSYKKTVDSKWESLYAGFEGAKQEAPIEPNNFSSVAGNSDEQMEILHQTEGQLGRFFQIKGKYILTVVKSGLMLINQKRAHQRILFDEYIYQLGSQAGAGQRLLHPEKIELQPLESELFRSMLHEINRLGFEIDEFGANDFVVNAIPADFPNKDVNAWIYSIIDHVKLNQNDFKDAVREGIVRSLAKFLSIPYGKTLTQQEMAHINDKLFSSSMPNLTPDGKPIISMVTMDELDKKFK